MTTHAWRSYMYAILQIDAQTVKHLDKNLFLGEEIKEVYHEIMRTIPNQHLDLDDVSRILVLPFSYHPKIFDKNCYLNSSVTFKTVDFILVYEFDKMTGFSMVCIEEKNSK